MREDPVFSGGIVKVLLLLLVVGAVGVGVFAVAGNGLPFDLPSLPDIEDTGVTTLENTDLSDTTINEPEQPTPPASPIGDPFTSAGFGDALSLVRDSVGANAELTRLFINDFQTQFIVRKGNGVEAWSVRADTGELQKQDATITISGSATIDDFAFSLSGVKAEAIDPMLAQAKKLSGTSDFRPSVLSLERAIPFGSRALEWTINAQGGGRNLLYRAKPDGSDVHNEGGKGTAIPPAAQEAQKLQDCIQAANNDPEKVFACLDKF